MNNLYNLTRSFDGWRRCSLEWLPKPLQVSCPNLTCASRKTVRSTVDMRLARALPAAKIPSSSCECFFLTAPNMRPLCVRGRVIAEFLAQHKKVKKVFYPGLPDHPQYELAQKQMTGFGSMISFETGSLSNANKMLRKVRVCSLAESLGGVETLISHPATMTHAGLGEKGRKQIGITDGMVRISVGIENVEDVIADLDQALSAI